MRVTGRLFLCFWRFAHLHISSFSIRFDLKNSMKLNVILKNKMNPLNQMSKKKDHVIERKITKMYHLPTTFLSFSRTLCLLRNLFIYLGSSLNTFLSELCVCVLSCSNYWSVCQCEETKNMDRVLFEICQEVSLYISESLSWGFIQLLRWYLW